MKKKFIKLLSLLLIALLFYYLYRQIQQNISSLAQISIAPKMEKLPLSLLFMFLHYMLIVAVYRSILRHTFGSLDSLSPRESFGIYYVAHVFKYVPGKVWSYSILMNAMLKKGFSVSKTLFSNLLLLILNITTPLLFAGVYYLGFTLNNHALRLPLSLLLIAVYLTCLLLSPKLLDFIIYLANKLSKKQIQNHGISLRLVVKAQSWYFVAYGVYIVSLAFLSQSISDIPDFLQALQIAVICMISMTTGFLALFAPGGIGVQDSLIFAQVSSGFGAETALLIMLAFRLMIFVLDIACAVLGLIILGKQGKSIIQFGGKLHEA